VSKKLNTMKCGGCLGRGVCSDDGHVCVVCGGSGIIVQKEWQCEHFIPDWQDCEGCIEKERLEPLKRHAAAWKALAKRYFKVLLDQGILEWDPTP
jgi:hypothetical protein